MRPSFGNQAPNKESAMLTAIFESWLVPDGNYPPLKRDQLVRLAFELEPHSFRVVQEQSAAFTQAGDGECYASGRILGVFGDKPGLLACEAGGMRFYIHGSSLQRPAPRVGASFEARGTLLVDHFSWTESAGRRRGAPDIFQFLRISRIRQVRVPESRISRSAHGNSFPTRVPPNEFGGVVELDSMVNQPFDEEFYVVDFVPVPNGTPSIPLTFCQ